MRSKSNTEELTVSHDAGISLPLEDNIAKNPERVAPRSTTILNNVRMSGGQRRAGCVVVSYISQPKQRMDGCP